MAWGGKSATACDNREEGINATVVVAQVHRRRPKLLISCQAWIH